VSILSQLLPHEQTTQVVESNPENSYQLQALRLRAVIKHLTDPIFAVEPDGTIFFFSEGASGLLNVTPSKVEGRKFTIVLPFSPKENLQNMFTEFLDKRSRVHTEITYDNRPFMAVMTPLKDSTGDKLLGGLIELKDLSEQKRLAKMQIDFVSIISHELRTPISNVKGYLDVLKNEATYLTSEHKTFLERAYASNERQEQTVERLLDLSDVEQGNIEVNLQKLNLDTILREVVKIWHPEAHAKGIKTKFLYPKFSVPPVYADEQLTYRVFHNLVGNAVKYTTSGTIVVKLVDEQTHVAAYVADTGPGIAEDLQKKIFQKFMRGENTLTETTQGSGLGLYLARRFIEIMGGTIQIKSEVGKGTAFKVTLPMYNVDPSE